ncbi:MAG: prepilin-type N-terminal cleavage/methylation domain-containing protein [Hyphomicrobiales bacterium]
MSKRSRRHRAQSGTTLIELLVSTVIIGVALVILVGMFSTGVIDSNLSKRQTAAQAATQYEEESIGAMPYKANPASYSECFASDGTGNPSVVGYLGSCTGSAKIRADVSAEQLPGNLQQWTIQIRTWPAPAPVGNPVSVYKVNR